MSGPKSSGPSWRNPSCDLRGVEALDHGRTRSPQLFERLHQEPSLPTAWHYLGVAWDREGDARCVAGLA